MIRELRIYEIDGVRLTRSLRPAKRLRRAVKSCAARGTISQKQNARIMPKDLPTTNAYKKWLNSPLPKSAIDLDPHHIQELMTRRQHESIYFLQVPYSCHWPREHPTIVWSLKTHISIPPRDKIELTVLPITFPDMENYAIHTTGSMLVTNNSLGGFHSHLEDIDRCSGLGKRQS